MPCHRRPVALGIAATVVASALQVAAVTGAHAAAAGAAPTVEQVALPPVADTVTDADARQGAIAAIVRGADGSPEIVEVTAPTVAEARRKAAAVPGAEGIAVDAPSGIAAEPYRAHQWSHTTLGIDSLPATDTTSSIVAVVDTGVRASHEDFASGQVLCLPGSNFVLDGAPDACTDPNGHGTHVAGIVAAAVNGKGISGIAPGTTILPVRVMGADGTGSAFTVADGIVWAANNGATVINASLGGPFSEAYDEAVAYATSQGALVVAAAGNDRATTNSTSWPASSPGALSVASTDPSGETSYYSYEGPEVDIAAPGSEILSLSHDGDGTYASMSGTSMASPAVAGVATLVKTRNPGYTPAQLTDALLDTAIDIESPGRDDRSGAGLVNPSALVTDTDAPQETVVVAPAAPTGVTATAGDGVVTVEFDAVASTEQAPVTTYTLYRDGQPIRSQEAADQVSSYVLHDEAVMNGVTYTYAVTATGQGGESDGSAPVTAQPQASLQAPAAPQGLVATAGDGTVTLDWTAVPSTEDAPVEHYRVHRDDADGGPIATVDSTGFVDRALSNGTTYRYSVTAVGAGGESTRSATVSSTPSTPSAPAPPSGDGDGGSGGDAGGGEGGSSGGDAGTAPVPPVPTVPVVAPAPVSAPAPRPVVGPATPAPRPVMTPTTPVLRPLPARVRAGQRLAVTGSQYRAGSLLTVTQTYSVRQRVAVRQPVTSLVSRRVTVSGKSVTRKVRVVTGSRTVQVVKLVKRTTKLADLRVTANGTVAGSVRPVRGVPGAVLTFRGVDRKGKAVVVTRSVRVG